ncbi:CIS tube protein [Yokenella regensburgei]|uniref:CIS tube protein n=1 Tax=Yokenella regensburgei TaxID=158877 RepID=UPI003ED8F09A
MNIMERGLEKLIIRAYVDREMKKLVGSVTAMYNPETLQQSYKTQYEPNRYINDDKQSNTYRLCSPGGLNLDLIFDARMPGNTNPLEEQLTKLNKLCCSVNDTSGEPNFLKISWGRMSMGGPHGRDFTGRATDMMVSYTLFDRDATPLRALVSLALTTDGSLNKQATKQKLNSPPVAVFSVPDESSLPLVAKEGGATLKGGIDPLSLADKNDLDSLHDIKPGQILKAPASGGQ